MGGTGGAEVSGSGGQTGSGGAPGTGGSGGTSVPSDGGSEVAGNCPTAVPTTGTVCPTASLRCDYAGGVCVCTDALKWGCKGIAGGDGGGK